jgi:hypothetical protein
MGIRIEGVLVPKFDNFEREVIVAKLKYFMDNFFAFCHTLGRQGITVEMNIQELSEKLDLLAPLGHPLRNKAAEHMAVAQANNSTVDMPYVLDFYLRSLDHLYIKVDGYQYKLKIRGSDNFRDDIASAIMGYEMETDLAGINLLDIEVYVGEADIEIRYSPRGMVVGQR